MAAVVALNRAGALDIASRQLDWMRDRLLDNHRIFDIHVVLADELLSSVEDITSEFQESIALGSD